MLSLVLSGNPQSTNHIYKATCRGCFASIYMSKKGKDLKEDYKWQVKSQYHGKPLTQDLKMALDLFFGDKRVRDIDNYNKLILDALSGLVFEDDKQIQELNIKKFYDKENPRCNIKIYKVYPLSPTKVD